MPLWTPPGGWCFTPYGIGNGVAAFSLTYGRGTLQQWIGGVLTTILGGGPQNGAKVQRAMNIASQANAAHFGSELGEFAEFVDALVVPTQIIGEALMQMAYATNGAVYDLQHGYIPAAQQAADLYTNSVRQGIVTWTQGNIDKIYSDLEHLAAQDLATAEAYANQVGHGIVTWTQQNITTIYHDFERTDRRVTANSLHRSTLVAGYSNTLATDVARYAEQETQKLTAELQATQRWAATQITQTRTEAATNAANAANTAISDQNKVVSATLTPIWAGTAASLNKVGADVSTLAPSVTPAITEIPTEVPPDLQVALQGITGGLHNLATAVDTCALPNCEEKNKLATEAKKLGGLVSLGAMLAFLTAAITEPTATAKVTADLADTVATDAFDAVRTLVDEIGHTGSEIGTALSDLVGAFV